MADPELVAALQATVVRQQEIIAALVTPGDVLPAPATGPDAGPSGPSGQSGPSGPGQHGDGGHRAAQVLRSVIEALDGALCVVATDGTVLEANSSWLRQLPRGPERPTPAGGAGEPRPGAIGTDFFAWCAAASEMSDLTADVAELVREVVTGPDPEPEAPEGRDGVPRRPSQLSVKGRVTIDGRQRWVVVRIHRIHDHVTARAVVSMVDITSGMSTQEKLRRATEEAQRLALVARATDNAVVITLPDGTIEWVNDPFVRNTGYSLEEVVGRPRLSLMRCIGDLPEFRDFSARIEQAASADGEFPLISRSGHRYWANVQVRPVYENDRVAHLVWVEQDVTARRDTQQRLHAAITQAELLATALSQEKTLLTGVISAVPQLVYWKDADGRYVGCNAAYLAFRGLDERHLLGRTDAELHTDDELAGALAALEPEVAASGTPVVDRKVDLHDSRGQLRSLLLSVLPLDEGSAATGERTPGGGTVGRGGGRGVIGRGVIGVGADITHARELERQLAQANRLESIGQLAAGIAHELNTPIQYVADNMAFLAEATNNLLEATQRIAALATPSATDLVQDVTRILQPLELDFLSEEIPGALTESREGLGRVTQIVRAMKDYAHPGTGRGDIDVNRAIESTVQVCRNEWKYVARVQLDLDPDAGLVPCFEGELKQVILNMIVNAAQAIGEDGRHRAEGTFGSITVTTKRTAEDFVIVIRDDGPGMTEEVRRRIFDPFFTTKEVGKGSGQGLSLAHSVIVTKHQGRIELETAPGQGACFTLRLPLSAAPEPAER